MIKDIIITNDNKAITIDSLCDDLKKRLKDYPTIKLAFMCFEVEDDNRTGREVVCAGSCIELLHFSALILPKVADEVAKSCINNLQAKAEVKQDAARK